MFSNRLTVVDKVVYNRLLILLVHYNIKTKDTNSAYSTLLQVETVIMNQ